MSVNGVKQHMDINIARCIKRLSNKNTANPLVGIRDCLSANIKFELAYFFDYAGLNNILALKCNHYSTQASPFRTSPSFMRFDPGNSKFPGVRFSNLFQTIPPPFIWVI